MTLVDLIVVVAIGWLIVRAIRKLSAQKPQMPAPYAGFPEWQVRQLPSLDHLEPGAWVRVVRASNPLLADAWAHEARRRGLEVEWVDLGTPRLNGWRVKGPSWPGQLGP